MKSVMFFDPKDSNEKTANKFIDWLRENKGDEFNEIIRQGNNREKQQR